MVDRDGDILPLPEPPDAVSVRLATVCGQHLLACWLDRKNKSWLGELDLAAPAEWTVHPALKGERVYVSLMHRDPAGRLVYVGNQDGIVHYQPKPGAAFEAAAAGTARLPQRAFTAGDGAVWIVPDHVGHGTSGAAVRFDGDGVETVATPGLSPCGAAPVGDDLVLMSSVSFDANRVFVFTNVFLDAKTQEVVEGPFDARRFGRVANWSRSADGSLWLRADKLGRVPERGDELWRWDGRALTRMQDGVSSGAQVNTRRNYWTWVQPPDLLALSRDRVLAGTRGDGLFRHWDGVADWIDWRHRLPSLDVQRVFAGKDNLVVCSTASRTFLVRDFEALRPEVNEEIQRFATIHMVTAPDGTLCATLPGDPVRIARWRDGAWRDGWDYPTTNYHGVGFDSESRPWVHAWEQAPGQDGMTGTTTVFVCEDDERGWTKYPDLRTAYLAALTNHPAGYQPGQSSVYSGARRSLFVAGREIWYIARDSHLHIHRDGTWWRSPMNGFYQPPFLNSRGLPRIVLQNDVLAFHAGKLHIVRQAAGRQVPQFDPFQGNIQIQRQFLGGRMASNRGNRGKPFLHYGSVLQEASDTLGNRWLVTPGGMLLGVRGDTVVETPLRGSPAVSSSQFQTIQPDGGDGLFIAYRVLPGNRRFGHQTTEWLHVVPKSPHLRFAARALAGENRVEIAVSDHNLPREDFDLRVRVDGGPWREGSTLTSVLEGARTIDVQGLPTPGHVFTSETLTLEVEVPGDLAELLRAAAADLGHESYARRKRARLALRAGGPNARPWLIPRVADPDPEVSTVAREILAEIDELHGQ